MPAAAIRVPERWRGPPDSANGGYACGLVAGVLGVASAEVTLRSPPPLERDLVVEGDAEGVTVRDGDTVVAEGRPTTLELAVPEPPSHARASEAAVAGYERWSTHHPFPSCAVCGPARQPGDGLRLFPGPLDDGLFACPWTPDESVGGRDGAVRAECVWAALDCPTSAPVAKFGTETPSVLGRLAASIEAPVRVGEPHVIVSWRLAEGSGRMRTAGAALFDTRGRLLASSRAAWIQLKENPEG